MTKEIPSLEYTCLAKAAEEKNGPTNTIKKIIFNEGFVLAFYPNFARLYNLSIREHGYHRLFV